MKRKSLLFFVLMLAISSLHAAGVPDNKNVLVSEYKLSWDVASTATTPAYRAEHYGVFISTTGNQPADFSLLFEETLSTTIAGWVNQPRELDISSYAGQTIYVAFRHFNITDMDRIMIDNVNIKIVETGVGDVILLNEDFQSGIDNPAGEDWLPEGWTSIDADGDNNFWYFGVRQGNASMRSESWATNPLTPDNWLVTPSLYLGYVGVNDKETISATVYPNPASDAINIQSSAPIARVILTDLRGSIVYQSDAAGENLRIATDSFVNGMYILRLFTENGTAEKKIQISR